MVYNISCFENSGNELKSFDMMKWALAYSHVFFKVMFKSRLRYH